MSGKETSLYLKLNTNIYALSEIEVFSKKMYLKGKQTKGGNHHMPESGKEYLYAQI
mgnify:FL=1